MKRTYLMTIFACWIGTAAMLSAQNFVRHTDIVVQNNDNSPYRLPWTGGMNNPQFSEMDINFDGISDIFVFDRGSNTPFVFLRDGNGGIQEAIDMEKRFPTDLHDWALLVRNPCNQAIFLYTAQEDNQVRVFGVSMQNYELQLTLLNDALTFGAPNSPITVPVYDVPAISDLNNDGDLDLLSFDDAGGKVQYYENQITENSLACNAFVFQLGSDCWGNFFEPGITNELLLNDCDGSNSPNAQTNGEDIARSRHPGSALLAIDLDSDSDKDLLLGDISFNNVVEANNGGTLNNAIVTSTNNDFPSYNVGVNMYIFPAIYALDADYDGLNDLVIAPNARTQSIHSHQVWLYHNNGSATNTYELSTTDWLVGDMIDVNRSAKPAFFDYNSDGLQDLVVGNYGYNDSEDPSLFHSQLALYENIGTANSPAFRLINDNWNDVQGQFQLPRLALSPTFGDLDGDGDQDMLLGDSDGYLHYFRNQTNVAGEAEMVLFQEQYAGIDAAQQNSPQLVDVDQDGVLDLLMGNHNGVIQYYHNNGTAQSPVFQLVDNTFGNVDVRSLSSPTGFATPQLVKQGDSLRLYVGSESGRLLWYDDIENNLSATAAFPLVTDQIIAPWASDFSKPALADLNGDGLLDMVVGTYQGGLLYFEQTNEAVGIGGVESVQQLQVYPNPANNWLHLAFSAQVSKDDHAIATIYDLQGKVAATYRCTGEENHVIDIAHLPKGMYFVEVVADRLAFRAAFVR